MYELLTTKEMAEADRLAVSRGTPSIELMENAGRAVADVVSASFSTTRPVIVFAGPGNNGGDGFVAARLLGERGYSVELRLLGDITRLRGEAATAAERYNRQAGAITAEIPTAAIIIDALFGAGLTRDVDGEAAAAIEAINSSGAHVIAVDLPSGINGVTGAVQGTAIRAAVTVTFFRK
jgi:ADP-dependent NAD(P)H-hydrate dehydratase / NAD(P)H-hydrate epimerase